MNVPGFPALPGTGTYYYPNEQSARLVWYHDHAIGITRLNAYAGIASAYIIVDDFETGLVSSGLLPDLVGIPLVIQDKGFVPETFCGRIATWRWGDPGSLWYPHDYEVNTFEGGAENPKGRWDWGPTADPPSQGTQPLPRVSAIPEAFFDTIVINGGVYPKVSVAPKRVRFRLLNGSQARFYHLNLYPEDRTNPGEARVGTPGPVMYQVGTEGGFLPSGGDPRQRQADPARSVGSFGEQREGRWTVQPAACSRRASRCGYRLQRRTCGNQLHSVQRCAGAVPGRRSQE